MRTLAGLQWKPMWNSQIGCLKGCTDYLGLEMSDAWLMGGCGLAFILQMDQDGYGAGASWYNSPVHNLCNNLGFTVNGVYGFKTDEDFRIKQRMAWENTKNAIDRGLPCYGYNLGIPEYYVVYRYEDDGYRFSGIGVDAHLDKERVFAPPPELIKRLSAFGNETYVSLDQPDLCDMLKQLARTKGFALEGKICMVSNGGVREILSAGGDMIILQGEGFTPWTKPGTVHIGMLEMYWVERGRISNDRDIVKEALEFALEHASSPKKWVMPPYKAGLDAYDHWINALHKDVPNVFGLSYNGHCWAECREQAALFLSEAADRIGGASSSLLNNAAAVYRDIYGFLREVTELLPFEGKNTHHYLDKDRLRRAAWHVEQAKRAEEEALKKLAAIVSGL